MTKDIPKGCEDCDFMNDCHRNGKPRLCYHGDLHSHNIVGSGARNIECMMKFRTENE
jgi:hypothetical protein